MHNGESEELCKLIYSEQTKEEMRLCPLPWTHLSTTTAGQAQSCCMANGPIRDIEGRPFSIKSTSIRDIFHSPFMRQLRSDLVKGRSPENCKKCWIEEDHCKKSKRQESIEELSDGYRLKEKIDYFKEPDMPQFLQINVGSKCNLKCRTCSPESSSKWIEEFVSINNRKALFLDFYKSLLNPLGVDSGIFWSDIQDWLPHIRIIEFMGGEPFFNEDFYKIIEMMILKKISTMVELRVSTNVVYLKKDMIHKIVSNFKLVGFGLSIDGIDERFNYLRHGADWESVVNNILELEKSKKTHDNLFLSITHTLSLYNIYYFREFHQFFEDNFPEIPIHTNYAYGDSHAVYSLPEKHKKRMISILRKPTKYFPKLSDWPEEKCLEVESLIEFLNNPVTKNGWAQFIWEVKFSDGYRNEDYRAIFSEYFKLIRKSWDTDEIVVYK